MGESETISTTLSVSPSDTVLNVKHKLQKQKELKVEQQRYFYGYSELKDDDLLSDYNIKQSRSLLMTAITTNGKSYLVSLDVQPNDTLNIIKSKLSQKENIKFTSIASIYFAGEMPDNKTLSDCNVMNKSIIHLMEICDYTYSQINNNWNEYQQMFKIIK